MASIPRFSHKTLPNTLKSKPSNPTIPTIPRKTINANSLVKVSRLPPKIEKSNVSEKYNLTPDDIKDIYQTGMSGSNGLICILVDKRQKKYVWKIATGTGRNSGDAEIFNEFKMLCQLKHKNIISPITLLSLNYKDKLRFGYVMPLYRKSLYSVVNKIRNEVELRTKFSNDMVNIVNFLHEKKIAHRDIRVANMLFDEKKERFILIDFGFAKKYGEIIPFEWSKTVLVAEKFTDISTGAIVSSLFNIYSLAYLLYEIDMEKYSTFLGNVFFNINNISIEDIVVNEDIIEFDKSCLKKYDKKVVKDCCKNCLGDKFVSLNSYSSSILTIKNKKKVCEINSTTNNIQQNHKFKKTNINLTIDM